jgi:fucose permease
MRLLLSFATPVLKASGSTCESSSIILYSGVVAIAGYFINYVTEIRPGTDSALGAKFLAAAQGCFAVGRFSGSGVPCSAPS